MLKNFKEINGWKKRNAIVIKNLNLNKNLKTLLTQNNEKVKNYYADMNNSGDSHMLMIYH